MASVFSQCNVVIVVVLLLLILVVVIVVVVLLLLILVIVILFLILVVVVLLILVVVVLILVVNVVVVDILILVVVVLVLVILLKYHHPFDLLDGREESLIGFVTTSPGFFTALNAEEVRVIAQRLATVAAEAFAEFQEDLLLDFRPLLEKLASRV